MPLMPSGSRKPRTNFEDPLQFFPRALTKLYTLWVSSTHPFLSLGHGVSFHYTCDLRNTGRMRIGNQLTVQRDAWLHTRSQQENTGEPLLIIDDYCFIGRRSHIDAKNLIHIERGVMLAAGVLIQDHGHAFDDVSIPIRDQGVTDGGRVRIGEGSWVGQGAVIICDSGELTLGRNCVVAANAVVTKSAPPYSVLSGNPARIVKQFDPSKSAWVLGAARTADSESAKAAAAKAGIEAERGSR